MKEVNQRTIPVQLIFFGLSLVVFVYVFLINAWVVDDAYITFRTVDNFLHGYGLRWNVDERVQVYTHPLWMLVMVVGSFITSDVFFTSIALSFFCSLGAILIVVVTMTQRFRVHTGSSHSCPVRWQNRRSAGCRFPQTDCRPRW